MAEFNIFLRKNNKEKTKWRTIMKNYRLYLIRHSITNGNVNGLYIGAKTDEPLCEKGIEILEDLKRNFTYPNVSTVFSSPLMRAITTAEILFGQASEKIILNELTENDFGEFEGRQIKELVNDDNFKKWITPSEHYTPVGGESSAEFNIRCGEILMNIFEHMMKTGIEQAACVTHGGVIMSMLAQKGMPKYPPEHWMADSGCGYVLQCNAAQFMRDGIVEVTEILPFGYLD